MAEKQTTLPGDADVGAFLAAAPRGEDARALCGLLEAWTGEPPVLWGTSIVGFGAYRYRYDSGREGTAPLVGFAPRNAQLVVYLAGGFQERDAELLERLGPHKAGKGCPYVKRLDDVDDDVLHELVERTVGVHRGADRAGDG